MGSSPITRAIVKTASFCMLFLILILYGPVVFFIFLCYIYARRILETTIKKRKSLKKYIGSLLFFALRKLLSFRYDVSVHGLERISARKNIIFASKHPAMVDSLMLFGLLWGSYAPRVIIAEKFFSSLALYPFMKIIGAIPVPETKRIRRGEGGFHIAHQALLESQTQLKNGDNLLLFPTGHLMRSGLVRMQNQSGLYRLCQACPSAEVVLVDVYGLWGSVFSARRHGGKTPNMFYALFLGLSSAIRYKLRFPWKRLPTRKVSILFESVVLPTGRRETNEFLESWYNRRGEEFFERAGL